MVRMIVGCVFLLGFFVLAVGNYLAGDTVTNVAPLFFIGIGLMVWGSFARRKAHKARMEVNDGI